MGYLPVSAWRWVAVLWCLTAVILGGCHARVAGVPGDGRAYARGQRPYQVAGIHYYPIPSARGFVQEGVASWYGSDFHGRATSSGERYDMDAMTAAHKTLPLGTCVKVTEQAGGASIIVRINDRGPFVRGRIIDLSRKAARALNMLGPGTAQVRIEAVQVAEPHEEHGRTYWDATPVADLHSGPFTVQVGAFQTRANACAVRDCISGLIGDARISGAEFRDDGLHRVHAGLFHDLIEAHIVAARLRAAGYAGMVVAVQRCTESETGSGRGTSPDADRPGPDMLP